MKKQKMIIVKGTEELLSLARQGLLKEGSIIKFSPTREPTGFEDVLPTNKEEETPPPSHLLDLEIPVPTPTQPTLTTQPQPPQIPIRQIPLQPVPQKEPGFMKRLFTKKEHTKKEQVEERFKRLAITGLQCYMCSMPNSEWGDQLARVGTAITQKTVCSACKQKIEEGGTYVIQR